MIPSASRRLPTRARSSHRERGQMLIVALLVLGVILILAGVFAGILNSAIRGAGFASERATISDFGEAGVRFAHGQLLNSELGADWRGTATEIEQTGTDVTRDPDAFYLRPPARDGAGVALANPDTGKADQGGPDGLGAFFRVNFDRGRALLRVRYAPGDPSIFSSERVGALLKPGRARNYIVIESVGRNGVVVKNDPTVGGRRGAVQFRNFGSNAAWVGSYARMKEFDAKEQTSRKLLAFAQIGLIDTARFITDKYRTARPAEIGVPPEMGVRDAGGPVQIPTVLGGDNVLYSLAAGGQTNIPTAVRFPGSGSLHSNADVRLYGDVVAKLNPEFGDAWTVAGDILPTDPTSRFVARVSRWDTATSTWVQSTEIAQNPNSFATPFLTGRGLLRDSNSEPDPAGYARGVGRKAPPTILAGAGEGAVSRYVSATRDTGGNGAAGNNGRYGHGAGVYVDNASDFQTSGDEESRQIAGTSQGLVQDWLSPFGDGVNFRSGWRGPFYIPVGAYVRLLSDGFVIARNQNPDQRAEERTWRNPDGVDSTLSSIRYRLGFGTDGEIHVVNTLTPGVAIDGAISDAAFQNGPVFNGILYFEGNVRLRGTIPTDVPLTIVTNRTAYIEGNVLKGTSGNDVTAGYAAPNAVARGARLTRRSRSALMIMARDYVALNTTMFFGPASEANVTAERGGAGVGGYSPVRVAAPEGEVTLQMDLPLRETNDNPSTWPPLAYDYRSYTPTNNGPFLTSKLVLTHTLESTTSGPANVFLGMNVNEGRSAATSYLFDLADSRTNSARVQYATLNAPADPPAVAPVYGLGLESWQQSANFETIGFPILERANAAITPAGTITTTGRGGYTLSALETNTLRVDLTNLAGEPSGNYLVGRAAATPADIRIEASVYAEDGSFFVIPGDWFNPNANDTRAEWNADRARFATGNTPAQATALADEERLTTFGATPDAPFYNEPLDVKVTLIGSVSENMPPPVAQQGEWLKRWGWLPLQNGTASDGAGNPLLAPFDHIADGLIDVDGDGAVDNRYPPNLTIVYDPVLATGRVAGYSPNAPTVADLNGANTPVRANVVEGQIQPLPPMPRLPVSPTLAYFGEAR